MVMRKELGILVFICILGFAPVVSAELIGWWTFDDAANLGADSSGKGNHGTVEGDAAFSDDAMVGNGALLLDGTDDYISVGLGANNMLANWTSNLTITAWIKPDSLSRQWNCFFGHTVENNGVKFELMTTNFRFTTLGVLDYDIPVSLKAKDWSHVAATFNQAGNLVTFYVNGKKFGERSGGSPANTATGSYNIGYGGYWEAEQYEGLLDEVRIYDNALTEAEIKKLAFRPKAYAPNPADGATGITQPLMQWTPGSSAQWHNVYLGTTPELGPADFKAKQMLMQTMYWHFAGLEPGKTYYWRIDEVEAGGTVYQGDVWSFTTLALNASVPKPADGATGEFPGLTLTWLVGKDGTASHVYFGPDMAAVANGDADTDKGQVADTTFNTPALRASTTYYWRVDTVNFDGSIVQGEVWSFTTTDAGPTDKIVYEVWSGIGGTAVSALTGNANYPKNPTTREYVNQFASPVDWADNYGQRLYGWLKPPETGDYTFWIAGDDEQQLLLSTDESPTNAEMVANVPGWTPANDFDNTGGGSGGASQKSAPIPLQAGQKYFIMALGKEGGGGDSTSVAWQGGPITTREIIKAEYVDAFSLPPLQAFGPSPVNGAVDTVQTLTLTWNAGDNAQEHEVYFGDDANAVGDANTSSPLFKGRQGDTSFDAGALEWGKTYYWRVDEINEGEAGSPWRGGVWSFTTANYIPVDDFESYTDEVEGRIFQTWIDGWGYTEPAPGNPGNGTGATVGYIQPPFAEPTIIHGGRQSMPFDYNNIIQPYYSETDRTWDSPQNWKVQGVTDLSLQVRGYPVSFVETSPGNITMSASGADIVNVTDEFRYAYKKLNGDGSLTVRVESLVNTATWAKAGVIIRAGLEPAAQQVHMIVTPANLVEFMYRRDSGLNTTQFATAAGSTPLPYWVRLTRKGSTFTGEYSANGTTWSKITTTDGTTSTIDIPMIGDVYIGLAVTATNRNAVTTAVFSNVQVTGATGQWQVAEIGYDHPGNDPASLYVAIQDSAGKVAVVTNPDTNVVLATDWTEWKIPLSQFTGVNLGAVKKMYIGVGDRKAPKADGAGKLFIDDIRVIKPAPAGQ